MKIIYCVIVVSFLLVLMSLPACDWAAGCQTGEVTAGADTEVRKDATRTVQDVSHPEDVGAVRDADMDATEGKRKPKKAARKAKGK